MTRFTLGQLARGAGLARSSLLHYERLGLLAPAGRSAAGYRLYGEAERERLNAICAYRAAGLPLAAIRDALVHRKGDAARVLESHLVELNAQIARLRRSQKSVATLLAEPALRRTSGLRNKGDWVALLRRAGFGEDEMWQWHAEFEAQNPTAHAAFLRSLGLGAREVTQIRRRSAR